MYSKNKSFVCEIVQKEKINIASFAIVAQTIKVMATVCVKCLVKINKFMLAPETNAK